MIDTYNCLSWSVVILLLLGIDRDILFMNILRTFHIIYLFIIFIFFWRWQGEKRIEKQLPFPYDMKITLESRDSGLDQK